MFGSESEDGFFGNGEVGFIVFAFVVEEPGREGVLGVEGIASEARVEEVGFGGLAIDELLGEGDGFRGDEAVFCGGVRSEHQGWVGRCALLMYSCFTSSSSSFSTSHIGVSSSACGIISKSSSS